MAKIYYEQLNDLVDQLDIRGLTSTTLEVRHFFSGAALYFDGAICASISPMGLAFKLPDNEVDTLIQSGRAVPLKYFLKGNIKKGYALFEAPDLRSRKWKNYFKKSFSEIDRK